MAAKSTQVLTKWYQIYTGFDKMAAKSTQVLTKWYQIYTGFDKMAAKTTRNLHEILTSLHHCAVVVYRVCTVCT